MALQIIIPDDLKCSNCGNVNSQSVRMQTRTIHKKREIARVITMCECEWTEYYWCPIVDNTTTLDNAGKIPF